MWTISNSVIEQPLKIPFIAAIMLVANRKKPELVVEVLKNAGEIAQNYINLGAWREVKLILRFLGCLQNIFEGDGVFPILEELFARAVDLQTASSEDVSRFFPHSTNVPIVDIFFYSVIRARACKGHPFYNSICDGVFSDWL